MAKKTIERFIARCIRLYEQEPEEALASARLGLYVRRWIRWTGAGLGRDDRKIRLTPDFHKAREQSVPVPQNQLAVRGGA